MDLNQRLGLILEAVKYCQHVKSMGMPASCYSKALREPVFFLWELRDTKNKHKAAAYRSVATLGLTAGGGEVVYDHAVPFVYLQRELLSLVAPTEESVMTILKRHGVACLITKVEDKELSKNKLGRSMPDNWDGIDPLARYGALDIEIIRNPDNPNRQEV